MEDETPSLSEIDRIETNEVEQPKSETKKETEVDDPYFHLSDGNYIGGLTMPS